MSDGSPNCTANWFRTEPHARGRPVDRDVHDAVTVVVGRHRTIAGVAELHGRPAANEPLASGRPIDPDIRRAVAVEIGCGSIQSHEPPRHRHVAGAAKLDGELIQHAADAGGELVHGDIRDAVVVVVARHGAEPGPSQLLRRLVPHQPETG